MRHCPAMLCRIRQPMECCGLLTVRVAEPLPPPPIHPAHHPTHAAGMQTRMAGRRGRHPTRRLRLGLRSLTAAWAAYWGHSSCGDSTAQHSMARHPGATLDAQQGTQRGALGDEGLGLGSRPALAHVSVAVANGWENQRCRVPQGWPS